MSAFIRKYGVATAAATHITIPVVKAGVVDFALSADWTPAAGDVKVTKNGATPANINTLPTYVANEGWQFTFTAAELQCKRLSVLIVDSATKAIEDQFFSVETYGHASAMMPIDFSDIVRMGLTALPNAAADAAGGLPISDAGGLDMDSILTDIFANYNAILANLALITTVDSVADAIKVVTDKFVFTSAGRVDSNLEAINDDTTAAQKAAKASLASYSGIIGAGAHTVNNILASDLTGYASDAFLNKTLNITSGSGEGAGGVINGYNSATGAISFNTSFPIPAAAVPAQNDTFTIS